MEDATDAPPDPLRRSTRIKRVPTHLIVNHVAVEGGKDILLNVLEDDDEIKIECDETDFPSLARRFIETEVEFAGIALAHPIDDPDAKDPRTIREAEASLYWTEWLGGIYEELGSLAAKNVYEEIAELPPGRKAVESKWVLHIKRDRDGLITRFKARLVAKGFTQIPGQDFNYTFAPVARWESIRLLLALAAELDMTLRQVDVKTAFLNGPLDEEIYMRKPSILGPGFWRLLRGLYGLKQAGRQWYLELHARLEALLFKRTESDWSMYRRVTETGTSLLTTSVDDMLIASTNNVESNAVVASLASQFEITDNGEPTLHLGCAIERDRANRIIRIHQTSYCESILRDFGFDKANPVATPMEPGQRFLPRPPGPYTLAETERVAEFPYGTILGKCMYLATCTRLDIAYTVRELARFVSNYGPMHITAVKHLLRYLRGTTSYGLQLGGSPPSGPQFIRALTDSDWGMDDATRKSVSGFIVMFGDSPVAWSSKQQGVVALSSCEAEYLATTHAAREVLWFRNLLAELEIPQIQPTTIFCDNQGTVACSHDPLAHSKMKHIAIREHFIRDCVMKRLIDVIHISNKDNTADLLTKPLHRILHHEWVNRLRLCASQGGVLTTDTAQP